MSIVYRLREQVQDIQRLQKASLDDGLVGLKKEDHLVGTEAWWAAIANGSIPLLKMVGKVCGFWPGQYGDGPASFEMEMDDGTRFSSLCQLEPREARQVFRIRETVTVEYVVQGLKHAFNGKPETKLIISMSVGCEDRD